MRTLFVCCLLFSGCITTEDPPYNLEKVDLGIKMEPQHASQWCWAAVAQSIALWHGDLMTQSDVVTYSFGRDCSPETCDGAYRPNKIFDLIGVQEKAFLLGENWPYSEEDFWRHELEAKHPMKIVLTNGTVNHMVVIGGYEAKGFYLYDPGIYAGKRQIVTREDLDNFPNIPGITPYHIDSVSYIYE